MLRWSLKHRGLIGTLRTVLRKLVSHEAHAPDSEVHPFDQQYGLDTGGLISGGRLATGSKNDSYNSAYFAMAPSRLQAGIEHWKNYLAPNTMANYSLIDLGSGKGRAIMLASEYPFRRVIGVELNPGLARIASENVQTWQKLGRTRCPIQLLTQDVGDLIFPDGLCVIYMYNPFAAPVVEQVIRNIEIQFADRYGQLDVMYFKPVAGHQFDRHPNFSLLWSGVLPLSDADVAIDRVSSANESCNIYRWIKNEHSRH